MGASPKAKTQEILGLLTSYINTGEKIDQFTFVRLLHEAKRLPDEVHQIVCTALVYGANKESEKAIKIFSDGLELHRSVFLATNYLAFLARTGHNNLHTCESIKLAGIYDTDRSLQLLAVGSAFLSGNEVALSRFAERLYKLSNEDQIAGIWELSVWSNKIESFRDASGLSPSELTELTQLMGGLATEFNQPIVSADYYIDNHGTDSAYVTHVLHDDPEIISDMNIELAMRLAVSGLMDNKKATAWFKALGKQLKDEVSQ
ncbi:hypothetical protein JA116_13305 [Morganella morganii]|uniref:hypothetical protein n=1 Tax=Morganella morganii TaxID=582 RepID=UPI0011B64C80|nr:hypothetical protein [Morganella morganii]QXO41640.1 hypothetical protein CXB74_013450 [Morganella morganii]QXO48851.1 hypothetical protein JC861_13370 [Morganella morganii]QXO52715.1 hypothetical protein JC830_13365 [Morganella morganii]QXO60456.1 hypothetical protein JC826_13210 [Morganella morganii]QXO67984.1 hypothetical protein JC792_13215 [Morganella morganii]